MRKVHCDKKHNKQAKIIDWFKPPVCTVKIIDRGESEECSSFAPPLPVLWRRSWINQTMEF